MTAAAQIAVVLAVLGGVLVVATAIGEVIARRAHSASFAFVENLNARIRSWWVIIAVTGGAMWLGRVPATLLFAGVSAIALREFLRATPRRDGEAHWQVAACALFVPLQYGLLLAGQVVVAETVLPLACLVAIPLFALGNAHARDLLPRIAERQFGVLLCVYGIAYLPLTMLLDLPGASDRGMLLCGWVLIVTQSSDVLQYICGKAFGRHAIAPKLSPAKTVEGFVGGCGGAALLGAALAPLTPWTAGVALGVAVIAVALGFVGGLLLSGIKRDRGIKDWSSLIPGHGGMLDRVDSLLLSAPAVYWIARWLALR